jgi:hypothetical protein
MPKVPKPPRHPKTPCSSESTEKRRRRWDRILSQNLEMAPGCNRCQKLKLRCFVDAATGHCAACIHARVECALFVPEEEWEKVQAEREERELALARSEEETARLRRELLETKARERSLALRDFRVQSVIDSAQEVEKPEGTEPNVLPGLLQPEPSTADLGGLQADVDLFSSFDPDVFDFSSFLVDSVPQRSDSAGGSRSPVPCSS